MSTASSALNSFSPLDQLPGIGETGTPSVFDDPILASDSDPLLDQTDNDASNYLSQASYSGSPGSSSGSSSSLSSLGSSALNALENSIPGAGIAGLFGLTSARIVTIILGIAFIGGALLAFDVAGIADAIQNHPAVKKVTEAATAAAAA